MSNLVETIERDGKRINVYDNGMERDADTGHFIKGPTATQITAENATVYVRKRQEKTAAALRSAIVAETMDKLELPRTNSVAAVAAAGGILWREIVLADPDAPGVYPRDRLQAWEMLGKYAQVLADPRDKPEPPARSAASDIANLTELVKLVRDVVLPKADVIEGKVNE